MKEMDHWGLKDAKDEEILEFMSSKVQSNFTHHQDINVGQREYAKAILDVRSSKILQKHNNIMIFLTAVITILTIIVAVLTYFLYLKSP